MIGLSRNVGDAVSVCLATQPGGRLDRQMQPLSCRQMLHEHSNNNDNDNDNNNNDDGNNDDEIMKRFPSRDELDTCRTILVSPEQPVSCVPVHKRNLAISSGIKH